MRPCFHHCTLLHKNYLVYILGESCSVCYNQTSNVEFQPDLIYITFKLFYLPFRPAHCDVVDHE